MFLVAFVLLVTATRVQGTTYNSTDHCAAKYIALNETGNISSPQYPGRYPDNQDACSIIHAAQGQAIRLEFEEFGIGYHRMCTWDYLEVPIFSSVNKLTEFPISQSYKIIFLCPKRTHVDLRQFCKNISLILNFLSKSPHYFIIRGKCILQTKFIVKGL